MFGSTSSFGQSSSSSPFGYQSVFGQNNNSLTPKPFGSASPFGSQTGGSVFGGTSTGVFGATQSSIPTFGASSSPAFGSSVPSFGASSTPAFGSGSSLFGGSSVFGQKPVFGGSGSTPRLTQTSPFGGTFQQTQSAFGSYQFGSSTTFGASSQPAFGSTSNLAFASSSTSAFGSTGSTFGVSNAPAFGSGAFSTSSAPAFVSSTTSAFGSYTTPAFGSSSTPAFGASTATKASSSPSFGFGPSPSFGQSNSTSGSSTFGTTPSPFGAQSSSFGSQVLTPALVSSGFGHSAFGGQHGGSSVTGYSPTPEVDGGSDTQPAGKLQSISGMPVYRDKSHEELRSEDYHLGDKVIGGSSTAVHPTAQSNPFGVSSTFGQSSTNVISSTTSSNPFPLNPSPFGTTSNSSIFTPSSTGIGSTSSSHPQTHHPLNPSPIDTSSSCSVSSSPLIFGSKPAPGLAFGQTCSGICSIQSVGVLQSNPPSLGQTNSAFGQTGSAFRQSNSSFGQTNLFNTSSTLGGNVYSSSTNLVSSSSTPSMLSTSNQTTQPAPTSSAFPLGNNGQTQAGAFASISGAFGQGAFAQSPSAVVMQPTPVSNPFGTLYAVPQMSIGRSGSLSTVQYGISSMPVTDRPAPVRVSSLLTSRHLYQRRSSLPARKYHPKNDAPKVPFYYDDEEAPSSRKEDALFIPRENPRALIICSSLEKPSPLKNTHDSVHRVDGVAENGSDKEHISNQRANGPENHSRQKMDSYITGHRAGEAAIIYEHEPDVEVLMPKLKHADYYTEPGIHQFRFSNIFIKIYSTPKLTTSSIIDEILSNPTQTFHYHEKLSSFHLLCS
ncbi:Nuclear pore complex protein nup98a [Thalictrum thalictroides]|uniref:Nuclear pore complex protein nup98a n=1 Tax=Thalictrum thalictroides TaxID=46969 RepID=A0A7J6UVB4_THATH|nr:Nuclear pore complex protein nup98a [Thalictrum thalictroides]